MHSCHDVDSFPSGFSVDLVSVDTMVMTGMNLTFEKKRCHGDLAHHALSPSTTATELCKHLQISVTAEGQPFRYSLLVLHYCAFLKERIAVHSIRTVLDIYFFFIAAQPPHYVFANKRI